MIMRGACPVTGAADTKISYPAYGGQFSLQNALLHELLLCGDTNSRYIIPAMLADWIPIQLLRIRFLCMFWFLPYSR